MTFNNAQGQSKKGTNSLGLKIVVMGLLRLRGTPTIPNDPFAGSPTKTLLRLLLPLNDQVRTTSQHSGAVASSQAPVRRPH